MSQELSPSATAGILGGDGFGVDAIAALLNNNGVAARRVENPRDTETCALVVIAADAYIPAARAAAHHAAQAGVPVVGIGDAVGELVALVPAGAWIPSNLPAAQVVERVVGYFGHRNGFADILPFATGRRRVASTLSERERESVVRYVSGMTVKEVSAELGVATTTVSTHLDRARNKYAAAGRDASNKLGLLMRALEDGLLPCPCARDDFDGERLLASVTGR